jgi:hypothetical protein
MASFFANYTCEYDKNKESIFCCTYVDEYSCQAMVEGVWRFCPYCGENLNILPSPENIPLPASPSPELESITLEELEASLSTSQAQEPVYIPPPRVQGADYMWSFMLCKSVVRGLTWAYGTKINFRSHYALLTLLANRYKMSIDQLVKTNPLTLIGDSYMAKRMLGNRTYRWMENRIAYQ